MNWQLPRPFAEPAEQRQESAYEFTFPPAHQPRTRNYFADADSNTRIASGGA